MGDDRKSYGSGTIQKKGKGGDLLVAEDII